MLYKILLIYMCCAFVYLDNKLYKMHGTYIKLKECAFALDIP